jgi:TrpR-related protein YerC/YecD
MTNLNKPKYNKLFRAFLQIKTTEEMAQFCYDLMTPQEISNFADRLEVAEKLNVGLSQRKVSKETGVGLVTVTRVNKFLNNGMNGYKLVISRLNSTLNHQHPR